MSNQDPHPEEIQEETHIITERIIDENTDAATNNTDTENSPIDYLLWASSIVFGLVLLSVILGLLAAEQTLETAIATTLLITGAGLAILVIKEMKA